MDELGTAERITSWGVLERRRSTVERVRFLDLLVNGTLLRDQLQLDDVSTGCTPLRSGWTVSGGLAWLDRLAGPRGGVLAPGRVGLFVCQVCGDVDCGVLSVALERSQGAVRWSRFGWEGEDDGIRLVGGAAGAKTFEFSEAAYDTLLRSLRTRVTASAREIPAAGHLWWKVDPELVMDL